ncbi:hypothetical protein MTP99_012208 [Tenebrio molitor]|nr:hypothetical protein MTP99_012208 [Tenebrio molitor]
MLPALVLVLLVINGVQSAKILGVFPMSARSHYILGSSLMRELAERGHDVTVVSPFGEENPPKKGSYRDVILTGFVEEHDRKVKELNIFKKEKMNFLLLAPLMAKIMTDMTEQTLNHTNVQKLINSNEQFDVVIVEEFMNHAHKAFASHFKGNLVVLSTLGANSWINDLVGNPTPLSYIPDVVLGYSSNMTFMQRLWNALTYFYRQMINQIYVLPRHNQLIKDYFPNGPDIQDVLYNASIMLINSHQSTNQPVPYVPSMVDIGGFHIKPPKKLPQDLQEFLDNAKEGVVYFSLGSNMKSSLLPPEKRQAFLDSFAKLKQQVLWKWEEDILPGKPTNVRLGKWLPQQDILAHPNVKLFVTHAGLLSTIETIYHGVPILTTPLGGDQNMNAQQMANEGFGLVVNFPDISEETLTEKLTELLNNAKYLSNAKKRSEFFHDRLVAPLDTAVYWVEYVIRHGGAPHLRVAGLDLPWYKYLLLDVIAFSALVGIICLYLLVKVVKISTRCCCKQKKHKLKKQ